MAMSSEKTERLINLTLGLLASKRYLTKNEIFRTISGYSGTPESMERMFERDKDDLRRAGIVIEVGGLDPLFEDEQGYLIRSSQVQIQPNEFSKEDLILMVLAANFWLESNLNDSAKNALLKISSIDSGIAAQSGFDNGQVTVHSVNHDFAQIRVLIDAIGNRRYVQFMYKSIQRSVAPLRLENSDGFWYLSAIENDLVKKFKIVRLESEVSVDQKRGVFDKAALIEASTNDIVQEPVDETLVADIRIGKCNNLRRSVTISSQDGEWDRIEMSFKDSEQMIRDLLWNGDDVKVVSPSYIKDEIILRLRGLAR
jgi:proteasome accessory factor B